MGAFSEDAILRCFFSGCYGLRKPSPHDLGCSYALAYVSFVFRILASYKSWSYASVAEFDVINLALAFPGTTFVEPLLGRTYSISS